MVGVTKMASSVSRRAARRAPNKAPIKGSSLSHGRPFSSCDRSRDKKPPNTSVWPECTLNSVTARRLRKAGPAASASVGSTELASTSMRACTAPSASIRGVICKDTPYGLNRVVPLPSLSVAR